MLGYKMITITYNNSSESKGTKELDKLLNGENEILQKDNKIIWSRKAKLLDDLKDCIKNNPKQEATVFVTKLKFNSNQTEEHNEFFNSVYGLIKNTEIAVIFLLERQDKVNTYSELLQFFDLIIEE